MSNSRYQRFSRRGINILTLVGAVVLLAASGVMLLNPANARDRIAALAGIDESASESAETGGGGPSTVEACADTMVRPTRPAVLRKGLFVPEGARAATICTYFSDSGAENPPLVSTAGIEHVDGLISYLNELPETTSDSGGGVVVGGMCSLMNRPGYEILLEYDSRIVLVSVIPNCSVIQSDDAIRVPVSLSTLQAYWQ